MEPNHSVHYREVVLFRRFAGFLFLHFGVLVLRVDVHSISKHVSLECPLDSFLSSLWTCVPVVAIAITSTIA